MPIRAKKILWPTDFSELSMRAASYAKAFCELFGSELHIVHVLASPLPMEMSLSMPAEIPVAVPEPEMIHAAREGIKQIIAEHFAGISNIHSDAFFGNAWAGVCEYARDNGIELIIVSTHGRTGIKHVVIGSTAERIVQHAPCPVLTIKDVDTGFVDDS